MTCDSGHAQIVRSGRLGLSLITNSIRANRKSYTTLEKVASHVKTIPLKSSLPRGKGRLLFKSSLPRTLKPSLSKVAYLEVGYFLKALQI